MIPFLARLGLGLLALALYAGALLSLLAADRLYYRLRYGRAWLDDFDRRMSAADQRADVVAIGRRRAPEDVA